MGGISQITKGRLVLTFISRDLDAASCRRQYSGVHQTASLKIRQTLEGLLLENGDLRLEQLRKIVRQDSARHPDRNPFRPQHQQHGQLGRQGDRLLVSSVVARNKLRQFVIEDFVAGQFCQAAFNIARGGRRITREDVAEVALSLDQVALVGHDYQSVGNSHFPVRMILGAVP